MPPSTGTSPGPRWHSLLQGSCKQSSHTFLDDAVDRFKTRELERLRQQRQPPRQQPCECLTLPFLDVEAVIFIALTMRIASTSFSRPHTVSRNCLSHVSCLRRSEGVTTHGPTQKSEAWNKNSKKKLLKPLNFRCGERITFGTINGYNYSRNSIRSMNKRILGSDLSSFNPLISKVFINHVTSFCKVLLKVSQRRLPHRRL